jgi:hypothetical protein
VTSLHWITMHLVHCCIVQLDRILKLIPCKFTLTETEDQDLHSACQEYNLSHNGHLSHFIPCSKCYGTAARKTRKGSFETMGVISILTLALNLHRGFFSQVFSTLDSSHIFDKQVLGAMKTTAC